MPRCCTISRINIPISALLTKQRTRMVHCTLDDRRHQHDGLQRGRFRLQTKGSRSLMMAHVHNVVVCCCLVVIALIPRTNAQTVAPSPELFIGVPTASPSSNSSEQFTDTPIIAPSAQPTSTPTQTPSAQPTSAPSLTPAAAPSVAPSTLSTPTPTKLPSVVPSSQPTRAPLTPTVTQTPSPLNGPTAGPSSQPTRAPLTPTVTQTSSPLNEPTAGPSSQPTRAPLNGPTAGPSSQPTRTPLTPTVTQTSSPLNGPTAGPSSQPTRAPLTPTVTQTSSPLNGPTAGPSRLSTSAPTKTPSTSPILLPTGGPQETYVPTAAITTPPVVPEEGTENATSPDKFATLDEFCAQNKNVFACEQYPSCAWNDESSVCFGSLDQAASWALPLAMVLAVLGILTSFAGFAFVYSYRKRPAVQLSQPVFLFLFIVGCAFLNGAILMYTPETLTPNLCIGQRWMFDLSFTITFATQFLKLWRVWRVFSSPVMTRVRITNANLLQGLLGICGVEVVFLALWTALDPPIAVDVIDGRCDVGNTRFIVGLVSYAYLGLLFLFAVIVSFKTRDLGDTVGESRQSFLIIHNTLLLILFNLIFSNVGMNRSTEVVLLAASVFYGTAASIAIIVHVKWDKINESHDSILNEATEKQRTKSTRNIRTNNAKIGGSGSCPQSSSGGKGSGSVTGSNVAFEGSAAAGAMLHPTPSNSFNTGNEDVEGGNIRNSVSDVAPAFSNTTSTTPVLQDPADEPNLFLRQPRQPRRPRRAGSGVASAFGTGRGSELKSDRLASGSSSRVSFGMNDAQSPPVTPSLRVPIQETMAPGAGSNHGSVHGRCSSLDDDDDDDVFSQRSESPQWNKSALAAAVEVEEKEKRNRRREELGNT